MPPPKTPPPKTPLLASKYIPAVPMLYIHHEVFGMQAWKWKIAPKHDTLQTRQVMKLMNTAYIAEKVVSDY